MLAFACLVSNTLAGQKDPGLEEAGRMKFKPEPVKPEQPGNAYAYGKKEDRDALCRKLIALGVPEKALESVGCQKSTPPPSTPSTPPPSTCPTDCTTLPENTPCCINGAAGTCALDSAAGGLACVVETASAEVQAEEQWQGTAEEGKLASENSAYSNFGNAAATGPTSSLACPTMSSMAKFGISASVLLCVALFGAMYALHRKEVQKIRLEQKQLVYSASVGTFGDNTPRDTLYNNLVTPRAHETATPRAFGSALNAPSSDDVVVEM